MADPFGQQPGQQLNAGQRYRDDEKLQQHSNCLRPRQRQPRQQIEDTQAEPIQRHIRPNQKAGVDPAALRIVAGKEPPVEQLQHPAAQAAGEEEEGQLQKHNDVLLFFGVCRF